MNRYLELTKADLEAILGPAGTAAMAKLNENMSDIGRQIAADQMTWVDKCMKDILTPNLYEDAKKLRNLEAVAAYMTKHDIKLVHMPDTLRLRIMVRGQIYGEWKANLTVDGEPVNFKPSQLGGSS